MKLKKRLGEMLIEYGLITEEKLQQALLDQKKAGLKLGQYLTRQGIINEQQIIDLLSRQLKIPKYHPENFPLDIALIHLITIEMAQKYQLAPLKKKGRLLTIAMVDPLDINAMDAIEVLTNSEVEPVVCSEREVNQIINSLYGMQSALGNLVDEIKIDLKPEDKKEEEQPKDDVQIASLEDMAGEAPVIRLVNSIFSQAVRDEVSDIHISPQQDSVQLRFRIDGKLLEVPSPSKSFFLPIVARIKILANMDITVSRIPQDGRFTLKVDNKEINVRVSAVPTIYGENIVLRLLDTGGGIYTLDRLGMSAEDVKKIEKMSSNPYGLILSTGPTGSGKSTSLYSILNSINKPDINIITLEDPVEYRINNIRQVQLNRKAGMTFAGGLRSVLRQDPDVIMVGEIRDPETAAISVQAAQTGHRVFSTIHTNDATGVITRFIDMGIEPFLISSVLLVSFAQRLVRTVCPYCKEKYDPPKNALSDFGITLEEARNADFVRGRGCYQCKNTGYKGRTGLFEVLVNDEMIQDMIMKKKTNQEITREAVNAGVLRTLREDAAVKVMRGITTLEEAASTVMT
ncbi:MAG: ATPase, T2SS/T4P/T4SS family [Smithella sp.]